MYIYVQSGIMAITDSGACLLVFLPTMWTGRQGQTGSCRGSIKAQRRGWGAGFSWLRCHGNALSINTLRMLQRLPF